MSESIRATNKKIKTRLIFTFVLTCTFGQFNIAVAADNFFINSMSGSTFADIFGSTGERTPNTGCFHPPMSLDFDCSQKATAAPKESVRPAARPEDLTTGSSAPIKSLRPVERPPTLSASDLAPVESIRPVARPEIPAIEIDKEALRAEIKAQAEADLKASMEENLRTLRFVSTDAHNDEVTPEDTPAIMDAALEITERTVAVADPCPPNVDEQTAEVEQEQAEKEAAKPTKEELLALCRGENDKPEGLQRGLDEPINDARDFLFSKGLKARNINNGYDVQPNADKGYSDWTCRNTNWSRARQTLEEQFDWTGAYDDPDNIPNPKHLSMQDYIDYRCHVANLDCESKTEQALKDKFNQKRNALTASQQASLPTADDFFDNMESNTKFQVKGDADEAAQVIQIPKEVTLAIMYTESNGDMTLKSGDDGYGLFQITNTNQKVEVDANGVVIGESSTETYAVNQTIHDENSVIHPKNNLLKFTEIIQEKYLALRKEYTEDSYGFDFDDLSEEEKWQFVIASYNGGQGTVNKSLKRMNKFNQAQRCNSCGTLNAKDDGSCNEISTTCEEPVAGACNKTVDFTYAASERFHNLGWHVGHDEDYNKYFKCIKTKTGFGRNGKGPCNVGVTFSYIRKVEGLKQCF